ncbi:hypothetical protein Tco_0587047 [Tanacetum coccineum]
MVESLPTMVDKHIKEQVKMQVPEQVKVQVPVYVVKGLLLERQENKEHTEHYRMYTEQEARENVDTLQVSLAEPYDDAHSEGENSAKRQKISEYEAHVTGESSGQVNEKEQGQSSSRNQEQIDDYNFWTESYALDDDEVPMKQVSLDIMKEVSLTINEEKKGSSGPEKIVLSLHKFPAIIFNYVDIKERTSRWVNKCVKKFNPYARYGVEHWKNPHAKIFYIKMQKEPGKPKEIVARRANECIVSITEPDYKNINNNDIEDMYLLIMNGKVPDYSETGIEKHKMFSIIYEPVHGIIYKNSKKEKRVMRHSEIHKFCDATLNIVLEGLQSYNNDVKYGYIQRELTKDEVEYLKLFEEEIEVRLKYHNQMRRWEMYMNGRPLGPRRKRP